MFVLHKSLFCTGYTNAFFLCVSSEGVGVSPHVSHMRKNSYIIAGCLDFFFVLVTVVQ